MVLESDWQFLGVSAVRGALEPAGGAGQFDVVLDEDAVVEGRDACGREQTAVGIKPGRGPDDIIGLPLTGGPRGVHERWVLDVDRAGGAIGIGLVFVGIEHLDFVAGAAEKNAAVAAALAFALSRSGSGPFDMELAIAEVLHGADVTAAADALHEAVAHNPSGGAAVHGHPGGEIFAVKQNDGVGRRLTGLVRGAELAGFDDRRQGTVPVVGQPVGVGLSLGGSREAEPAKQANGDQGERRKRFAEVGVHEFIGCGFAVCR